VNTYNHAVHKISQKLKFCEKDPSDLDKIEKTLSTMLPSEQLVTQQYREKGFTVYANLIQTLHQAEKNHELTIWNSQQRPPGTAPLPEVHVTQRTARDGSSSHPRNHSKPKSNNGNKACFKCGCYDHFAKKCKTPQHLVDLYQKSMGHRQKAQGKKYEAHFVPQEHEVGTSAPGSDGAGPSGTKGLPQGEASSGDDNMIMEYESNDIFWDLN